MKKLILPSLMLLLCSLGTGCVGYGMITKNLSKDGAIVRVVTPYGTILRVGTTTNQVRITTDGQIFINEVKPSPEPARPQAQINWGDDLDFTVPSYSNIPMHPEFSGGFQGIGLTDEDYKRISRFGN